MRPHPILVISLAMLTSLSTLAQEQPPAAAPVEIHTKLTPSPAGAKQLALTLDACSGHYDAALIDFLIDKRIPATLFVTKRWLNRNALALEVIKSHLDLFQIENHGAQHRPAVIGEGMDVYGIPAQPDVEHVRLEVQEGARAIEQAVSIKPHWYRGATALYDAPSLQEIQRLGWGIAGFSLNADSGATLPKAAILRRLQRARAGDVIIAHMNKPDSDTAEALQEGLAQLKADGFEFVRFDQVALRRVR